MKIEEDRVKLFRESDSMRSLVRHMNNSQRILRSYAHPDSGRD